MKSRTNESSSWLQGRLFKSAPVIVRVAALLLLAVLAAGQRTQAQTPVLRLQAANYNASTGVWTNSANGANNATYSGGTKPSLVSSATPNGASAVNLTTANYFSLASSLSASAGYTVFAYMKPSTTAGRNALTGGATGGNALEYNFYSGKQNYLVEFVGGGGSGTATIPTSSFSLIDLAVNSSAGSFRYNGSSDGAVAGATFSQPIARIGGNTGGGDNLLGQVAEIDIYSGVLTPVQITNIENALTATYVSSSSAPVIFSDTSVSPSTNTVGASETISASFVGTGPISYQWQFSASSTGSGAVNLAGATSNTLSLVNLQLTNSGYYSLRATNTVSPFTTNSSWVQLTVQPLTPVLQLQATNYNASSGLWTATVGPNAQAAGGNPTIATFATPNGGSAVVFGATNYLTLASSIPFGSGAYTAFAYIKPGSTVSTTNLALFGGANTSFEYRISGGHQDTLSQQTHDLNSGSSNLTTTAFSLIDATVSGSLGGTYRFNGSPDGTSISGYPFGSAITTIGARATGTGQENFAGQIAEIDIYTNVLTAYQITNVEAQLNSNYVVATSITIGPATASPTNVTYAGNSVTLAATVVGANGATSYQWQTDNGSGGTSFSNLGGATLTNYVLNTTSLGGQTNEYQLVGTPSGGNAVTSAPVTLIVRPASAPVVLSDTAPNPNLVMVGGYATFTASFTGTLPVGGYQWQVATNSSGGGAVNIAGATNTSLTLTNVQLANSGYYYSLQATNVVSPYTNNSSWAQLTVQPLAALVKLQATNYNPTTGVWNDSSGNGNNATYTGAAGTTPTFTTFATPNGSSAVSIATNGGSFVLASSLSAGSGYTVFAYVKPTTVNSGGSRFALTGGSSYGALEYDFYQGHQNYLVEYVGGGGSGSSNIPTSSFSMVDLAVNSSGATFRFNGAADSTNGANPTAGAAFTSPITRIGNNEGNGDGLVGQIAEVDIYSGVLTPYQITNVEAQLTTNYVVATSITIGPATAAPTNNVYAGTAVTLAAPVLGANGATSYQWQTDNGSGGASFSNLGGATTTNYVLDTTSLGGQTNEYQLVGTPTGGIAVTSVPVTLTIQPASAPMLVTDATPNVTTVGGNAIFSATFAGTLPIGYQWQVGTDSSGSGAVNVAGATNATLMLNNLQLTNSGYYYSLLATNVVSPFVINSSWAELTVQPLTPALQLQAAKYNPTTGLWTATVGANAQATGTFPTLASGVTSNGSPAVVFNGANKLQLATSIPATNAYTVFAYAMPSTNTGNLALFGGDTGAFEYRISAGKQDALKQAITDLGPSTTTVSSNGFSVIDATVSGSGGAYRLNGVADGTNAGAVFTNNISSIGARDTGTAEYFSGSVVEIDIYNGVLTPLQISNVEAQLTAAYVTSSAPLVWTDTTPNPNVAMVGGNTSFSATFTGNLPIGYQWQVATNSSGGGAVNIAGATNTTLTLGNLQLTNSGYYSLQATNAVSPYTNNSTWAQLTVQPLAALVQLQATNYNPTTGVWSDSSGNGNNATYTDAGDALSQSNPTLDTYVTPNGSSAVNLSASGGVHSGSLVLASSLTTNGGYTVFAYVKPTTVNSGGSRYALTGGSSPGALEYNFYQGNQNYLIEYTGGGGSGSSNISTSGFSMVDVAVNSSGGAFRLNGAADGSVAGAIFTQPITRIGNNEGGGDTMVGQVAEIDIYSGVLNSIQISNVEAQLTANYITASSLVIAPATVAPTNVVYAGAAVTLSAPVFGGTGTTTYQWQTDNGSSGTSFANIGGATNISYVLNTAGLLGAYEYQLVGTPLVGGSATSAPVALTVLANTNAYLASLVISNSAGALVFYPSAFTTNNYGTYYATNSYGAGAVTVLVTNVDPTATNTLFVGGNSQGLLTNGIASAPLTLAVGTTNVTVQVVSQDLSVTNTYLVAVTQLGSSVSSDASLSYLALSPAGTLSPGFSPSQTNYTATNAIGTGSVTVTVTNTSLSATNQLFLNGVAQGSTAAGSLVGSVPVAVGSGNVISVVVTAQDGVTISTNTVTVTVLASTNALLSNLSLSPGSLSQTFSSGTTSYTATNTYPATNVTVTATSADGTAALALSFNTGSTYGILLTNSVPSVTNTMSLASPANTLAVRVVSQDLSQTNVYTVNELLRPSQSVPHLTNSVSGSSLVLNWAADHLGYRLLVQTNNLNKGVSGNTNDWAPVANSATITATNIAIIKSGATNEYYKLVYP